MIYYKTDNIEEPARFLADKITAELKNSHRLLWLVPGGSAIKVAALAYRLLPGSLTANLTITLTDERYGDVGHKNSNSRQLEEAGLKLTEINFIPVLNGSDINTATEEFAAQLERAVEDNDYSIGLFGIGADGHTAGIKPNSPAVTSRKLTVNFLGEDFNRITVTPKLISRLDEAVVYAAGNDKQSQLEKLEENIDISAQPAQALKFVPVLTIFNDYKRGRYENSN